MRAESIRANIFNISAPQRYTCQVYRYHNTLSRLYVSVYKDARSDPAFYLLFSDVAYFAGPVNWTGANFALALVEHCLDLMVQAALIEEWLLDDPDVYEYLAESVHLYVVSLPAGQVQIIAGSATILQAIPADL